MTEIKMERVTVTPALAEEWLKRNTKNRKLRKRTVNRYAEAMKRGQWLLGNDAIVFDENGDIANGQHRLSAVAESGMSCDFFIVHGLPATTKEVLDIGLKRSASDLLYIHGYADERGLSAAYTALIVLRKIWAGVKMSFEGGDLEQYPTIHDVMELASREFIGDSMTIGHRFKGSPLRLASSMVAALHHEFASIDSSAANRFFDRLLDGEEMRAGDPIYRLRHSFIADAIASARYKRNRTVPAALIIKTWNYWREGRTDVKVVSWKPAIEPFPQILELADDKYKNIIVRARDQYERQRRMAATG